MKRQCTIIILLAFSFCAGAGQPDAASVIEKSRELTMTGSLKAAIGMTITEKNGAVRSRSIGMSSKSYGDGTEKRLIRFLAPADVKGTALLIIDKLSEADEMWIFLPALKKTRRISGAEQGKSFMSSEFSNADMSSPPPVDFKYRHLAGSGSDGKWIIESLPASDRLADEYGYSRKISHLDSANLYIQKMEFYNFDNKLFKVIEIRAVEALKNGKYLIKDMKAENLLTGRASEIKFSSIEADTGIDDSVFTLQNLAR